jgi:chromate transporter
VGYAVAGVPGGLTALAASILPPTTIILGITMVLHRIRREVWVSSFIEGLTPAISVLMIFTAWKIFEKGGNTGPAGWLIGGVSLAAMFLNAPERLVIIIAGLIGAWLLT